MASMEAGSKRKRDLECPRITFHAPDLTFERLFREDSLQELKNAVKNKLGLASDVEITLTQVRNGPSIVLEDEDDFDAFYNVLHSSSTASVRVTTNQDTYGNNSRPEKTSKKKKQKLDNTTQSASTVFTPATTTPTSRKRAVSFIGSKSSHKDAAEGPPAKRPKFAPENTHVSATPALASTPSTSIEAQRNAPSSAVPRIRKDKSAANSTSPTPDPSSSTPPAQANETVEKKSRKRKKKKAKKGGEEQAEAPVAASVAEAINKANKAPKRNPTVTEVAPSTTVSAAVVAQPAKESSATQASATQGRGRKDLNSQEAQPTVVESQRKSTLPSEPKKKRGRSKSKVREATASAVESETNDAVSPNPDPQVKGSLTAVSRLMIEKYFTPAASKNTLEAEAPIEAPSAIQPTSTSQSDVPNVIVEAKPTCPYCGKVMTHDRSHCPMIRAKIPSIIEKRIEELKQDTTDDPDNVRANAIEVLEATMLRKWGTEPKKKGISSNVSSSERSSTKPFSSAKLISKAVKKAPSLPKPTPASRRDPSPSPPSSSDESTSLQKPSSELASKPAPPRKSLLSPLTVTRPPPVPSATAPTLARVTSNESDTEDSSEDEEARPQVKNGAKSASLAQNSGEETSDSSEDESIRGRDSPRGLDQPGTLPSGAEVSGYSEKDLETLIRGPDILLKSIELSSSETSEDEDENAQLEHDSDGETRGRSRKTRMSYVPSDDSSDEEMEANDGSEDDQFQIPSSRESMSSVPPIITQVVESHNSEELQAAPLLSPKQSQPSQKRASFQEMNDRLSSVETDKAGNDAFEQILAEENAVFDLASKESPQPSSQEATSRLESRSPEAIQGPDQNEQPGDREPEPAEGSAKASEKNQLEDVDEDAEPLQTAGSDPIEAPEALEDTDVRQRSPIEDVDMQSPVAPPLPPPESSPEEPEREATPKPGILQRMRNRMGLASPRKEQTLSSDSNLNLNLTVTPGAKPRSTRASTLRVQQASKADISQGASSNRKEKKNEAEADHATPIVPPAKPSSKRRTGPASKPASTRSKATGGKNQEKGVEIEDESEEAPDPLPRRSTRATSRIAAVTSSFQPPVASTPNASQQTTRKTRSTKSAPPSEQVTNSSQQATKGKETKKTKRSEAKPAAKSPTPPPTNEDAHTNQSRSQTTGNRVPLPPSPPMSLDAWEVMQTETPVATHSDVMVDELRSDLEMEPIPFPLKPQFQRKSVALGRKQSLSRLELAIHDSQDHEKGKAKGKANASPLFMPSETQDAFPYSQYQSQLPDPEDSNSSDSETEVLNTVVRKPSASQPQATRYRKLSDMASQGAKLFTPKLLRQSTGLLQSATASVPAKRKERLSQAYGMMGMKNGNDDSDDESGQGSDSDAEKASHIPKSRKAGASGLKGRTSVA
ncbi:hypothetical protein NP233_g6986 [Leucocoprinus birnbaumii]|uniref:Uncharacterized protein n=1 Tax=Leucocoprinus birnbaumii TaxID=56174 RepID=A0AAD5YT75_9AGAR|nr:hypothetical protein NP233_g6986 [Leucocoprinus birnbaumii]